MPAPVVKQVQDQVFRSMIPLLLSDRDPNRSVNATGDNTVEISDKEGHSVTAEFDKATGLPLKVAFQSAGPQGAPVAVVETYSDWKEADGLKYPAKVQIEQAGKRFADVTVSGYKTNTGLTVESLGAKP
jgi:hypothetical protein